jgi:hypothetical protein
MNTSGDPVPDIAYGPKTTTDTNTETTMETNKVSICEALNCLHSSRYTFIMTNLIEYRHQRIGQIRLHRVNTFQMDYIQKKMPNYLSMYAMYLEN